MENERITPMKAIRLKCLNCCCGSSHEVKLCPCTKCPLYPFREGRNPFVAKREYTDEQKQAIKERLANSRLLAAREKSHDEPTEGVYTSEE